MPNHARTCLPALPTSDLLCSRPDLVQERGQNWHFDTIIHVQEYFEVLYSSKHEAGVAPHIAVPPHHRPGYNEDVREKTRDCLGRALCTLHAIHQVTAVLLCLENKTLLMLIADR